MGVTAEELKLLLTGDPSGAKKAIAEVLASQEQLVSATGAANTKLASGLSGPISATTGLSNVTGTLIGLLGQLAGPAAIGAAIKSSLDYADGLVRLSDKTGLSIEALGRLEFAAGQSGNTLDQVTTAITQMQRHLAGGDTSVVTALGRLGLSLSALMDLRPDEQFKAIAEAIAAVPDPAQRAELAIKLFGRAGAEVLPTMKGLADGVADSVTVMSTRTAQTLDAAGDVIGAFTARMKLAVANVSALAIELVAFPWELMKGPIGGVGIPAAVGSGLPQPTPAGALPLPSDAEMKRILKQGEDLERTLKKNAEASARLAERKRELAQHLAQVTTQLTAATFGTQQFTGALRHEDPAVHNLDVRLSKLTTTLQPLYTVLKGHYDLLPSVTVATYDWAAAHDQAAGDLAKVMKQLTTMPQSTALSANEIEKAYQSIGRGAKFATDLLAQVPVRLGQAFTGGGGLKGAVKALASDIGGSLFGASGPLGFGAGGLMNGLGNKLAGVFGQGLGAALPGIGTAIGAAIPAIAGLFGKLFKNPEKEINPVRQAYVDAAGGLAALNEKAMAATGSLDLVHRLLDARNAKQYEAAINDLNAAFDRSAQAEDKANQYARELGLSIEELGPAWARQRLEESGGALFEKWSVLEAKGADMTAVTTKMSGAIQEYFLQAKKTGTEIPEAWRPMLQRMVDMGLLVDEGGNKIESLDDSGVSFAESMTKSVKTVVDSIKELVAALRGIPRDVDVNINGHYRIPDPDLGAQTEPIPSFSNRTLERVTGAGLALLHPGDVVGVPRPGLLGGMHLTLNVQGSVWTSHDLADMVRSRISEMMADRYPLGVG